MLGVQKFRNEPPEPNLEDSGRSARATVRSSTTVGPTEMYVQHQGGSRLNTWSP